MVIKNPTIHDFLLRCVHDHRINQGMWLASATATLILLFLLFGHRELAIFPVLAVFPVLLAGVDRPGPRFLLPLLFISSLFFLVSMFVLFCASQMVAPPLYFFPLIFFFAMFAVYGNDAGKLGTGAMCMAIVSLSWQGGGSSLWLFPFLMALGTFWYGLSARVWMLWWGHRLLRDIIADMFAAMAMYYEQKVNAILREDGRDNLDDLYRKQQSVYDLIWQGRNYLNRFVSTGYDRELAVLKQDFLFAVDVMELLQSNQHTLTDVHDFIITSGIKGAFADMAMSVTADLKKKSFAVRTRTEAELGGGVQVDNFKKRIVALDAEESSRGGSMFTHLQMLRDLMNNQSPAFARELAAPDPGDSIVNRVRPHLSFSSPVFRYALRLAVTISCGIISAGLLGMSKDYWVLLAILLVMQSGYLLTRTMIWQRVAGTLAGVIVAILLMRLFSQEGLLIAGTLFLSAFSFSMIFRNRTWAITGVTALVVVGYQLAFGQGEEVVWVRLVDSLLGCGLAFVSNILLWPQYSSGGIKRLIRELLLAQEDILIQVVRSMSDRTMGFEQLSRRRLKLYTAQNNLLASYQQMLREPRHTRRDVESVQLVISHFVAASAHINALLPLAREINPMPFELTTDIEQEIIAMFDRCNDNKLDQKGEGELRDIMKKVYNGIVTLRQNDQDPKHAIVIHLLKLIYDRLLSVFAIIDCRMVPDLTVREKI